MKKKGKHGGARRGAGRPPKKAGKTYAVEDAAMSYLADVAAGLVPPQRDRVSAARALLPYQAPRRRAPAKSPPPSALQEQQSLSQQRAAQDDWRSRAAAVRARLARKE